MVPTLPAIGDDWQGGRVTAPNLRESGDGRRNDAIAARLDNSVDYGWNSGGTWEFNLDSLEKMCMTAGISFQIDRFDTAQAFLSSRPEWAPPKLEFEVDHLRTERVREWGLAIALGLGIAAGFGVAGGFLLAFGPIGVVVKSLELFGVVVAATLTIWSHSKWRMKRSLRKRSLASR